MSDDADTSTDPTGGGDADGGVGTDREGSIAVRAVGAYAPPYRIECETIADAWGQFGGSGIDRTAVAGADENALTMAVAAARRALAAGNLAAGDLDYLAFATTTPPLEEEDLTARLGSTLGLGAAVTRQSFGASTRAGTRALRAVADAAPDRGLVVAADCPRGEPADDRDHAAGAGAAALLVGTDGPARVTDLAEYAEPAPGTRFRRRGSERVEGLEVTSYDRATFVRTVGGAVDGLETDPGTADAAAVQSPDGALPYRATDALGVDAGTIAAAATVDELGDTGAASPLLGLATALEAGHDRVLVVGYGSGSGADALVVDADPDAGTGADGDDATGEAVPTDLALDGERTVSYTEYLRLRGEITPGPPDGGGAYVSVPAWKRSIPQRHRLVAGRCVDCGALSFPPEGACVACGSLAGFEAVELPGTGTVEAVTTIGQGGAPPEFAEQQAMGGDFGVTIVAFDGPDGRTTSVPAQVADGYETPAVGDRVVSVIRRIYTQEGVTRYGTKVRPSG